MMQDQSRDARVVFITIFIRMITGDGLDDARDPTEVEGSGVIGSSSEQLSVEREVGHTESAQSWARDEDFQIYSQ